MTSLPMWYIVTLIYIFTVIHFLKCYYRKMVRASEKCTITTFIQVDIRNRMEPL